MAVMNGCDISTFQKSTPTGMDFYIMRASYGFCKDARLDFHYNNISAMGGKAYGFYHFGYPQLGHSATQEADFFLSLVGHHAEKCIFALDFEGGALDWSGDQVGWCLEWLNRVYERTGSRPLLYIQGSAMKSGRNWKKIADANYGLWAASGLSWYDGVWKNVAIQQHATQSLDYDTFFGDRSQWEKYCSPDGETEATPEPEPETKPAVTTYTVQKGDALSKIAAKYDGVSWRDIYHANSDKISDPNLIYPGQVLTIPTASGADSPAEETRVYYTVKRGDSLTKIARAYGYGDNWRAVYALNGSKISDPDHIEPGWVLRVK